MSQWNRILAKEKYSPEEPDELVVDFVCSLKRERRKVLDLGCGSGRHIIYLARHGFEAHGIDISIFGLRMTKKRVKMRGLEASLVKCDMKFLPYIDSCFDDVVSIDTIYHQKLKGIQQTISEIHRVLRSKGSILINFLSRRTYIYGKGVEIKENTFIPQNGWEKGFPIIMQTERNWKSSSKVSKT